MKLRAQSLRREHGATTLVVVMALFLIVAMLAAFASRNMVYEQRIASNYYRAGVAYEAAQAGVEWALAMVNGDTIDATCKPSAGGADDLRSRYMNIDQSSRAVTTLTASTGAVLACFYNSANNWTCQCPALVTKGSAKVPGTLTSPAATAGAGLQPMFSVGFKPGARPGTARLMVTGCTGLDVGVCKNNFDAADASLGTVGQAVDVALVSALKMPPVSPLVVRGEVKAPASTAALGVYNTDPSSSGLLLQTGTALTMANVAKAEGLPGSIAGDNMITGDTAMHDQTAELFFASFFGMNSTYYRNQPKMRAVTCSSDCAPLVATQITAGAQMLWLNGEAAFSTGPTLGSATKPVIIVVNGNLTINQPIQIYGLLYVRGNLTWTNSSTGSPATVTGAVVTEGDLTASGAGSANVVYNAAVMQILNNQRGSFVRVPGSSWDQAK